MKKAFRIFILGVFLCASIGYMKGQDVFSGSSYQYCYAFECLNQKSNCHTAIMQKLFFVDDTTIVFFQFVKDGIDFTNCAHTYDSVVVKGKFKTFNSNVEVFIDDKKIYDFISLYVNATPACYEKFFKISGKYQIVSDGLIKWEKRLVKRLKYYKFGYGDRKKSARMIKCENQNQVMRIMTFAYLLFDQVTFKNKL